MSSIDPHFNIEPEESVIQAFTAFYQTYYDQEIHELGHMENPALEVDYEDLKEFDEVNEESGNSQLVGLTSLLRESPGSALQNGEQALRNYPHTDVALDNAVIRVANYEEKTQVRDIRTSHVNTFVSIEGIVSKATKVLPKLNIANYVCLDCGEVNRVPQVTWEREYPHKCTSCETKSERNFRLDTMNSVVGNFQRIQVQESPEELKGGQTPESIDVSVHGSDITGKVSPGERVTVSGILKARDPKDSAVLQPYMEGNNLSPEEQEFEELSVTPVEEQRIMDLANDPQVYDKLVQSLAPSIYGYKTEKLAVVLQLFSGVRKQQPNGGSRTRGDIHILFIGDPGTGKSQVLRYVKRLSPRGIYTSGKGTSSAGLTAAAVKDSDFDDKWTLSAGAMVLADNGVAAIDELDKMKNSDRSAMHEALEQQTVSVAKAGINATLKSRCSLLGAANPALGRWDENQSIPSQIEIEPALLSRFDLIFTIQDRPEEEKDTLLADHIIESNTIGQRNVAGEDVEVDNKTVPTVSPELFRKYVAYARKECNPILTQEAHDHIREYYLKLRDNEGSDKDTIAITARKLEALIRVAEAAARIQLSESVELKHAIKATDLMTESMKQTGRDPETGEFDAMVTETGIAKTQRDRITQISAVIEQLCEESDEDLADRDDIIAVISNGDAKAAKKVEESIDRLASKGEIYSPQQDKYRTM